MRKKVTVRPALVRGRKFYRVRWHEAGKVRRQFFTAVKAAEMFAASKRNEALSIDARFSLLAQADKDVVLLALAKAKERGLDLLELVSKAKAGEVTAAPGAGQVLGLMLAEKKAAGLSADYLYLLKLVCSEFIEGREAVPLNEFSLANVKAFLGVKGARYRATVRARLSAFFNYGVRNEWLVKNPCWALERLKVVRPPTVILSPDQARGCLNFLLENAVDASCVTRYRPEAGWAHVGLGWFVLSAFGGLRPDEAYKCEGRHLHLEARRPFVEITPDITKTGMQRIVYVLPEVARALRWAFKHGSPLPLGKRRKTFLLKKLRGVIGRKKWPKDVTRHSAASYWLALARDPKHVAEMLGHTEAVQRKHYKKPVERTVARSYFDSLKLIPMGKHRTLNIE